MRSASAIRAWRELSRHRLRTFLTVLALAVAVVGVWIFATPQQLGAAMDKIVAQDRLSDVTLYPDGVAIDDEALAALRSLPNVDRLDIRSTYFTTMRSGDNVQDVWVIGVRDFGDQVVNVVTADSGRLPSTSTSVEVVTDAQNGRSRRGVGAIGDTIQVEGHDQSLVALEIVGSGSTVHFGNTVVEGAAVVYAPMETVSQLAGYDVFTRIEFIVGDRSDDATTATIDRVRAELAELKPRVQYNAFPDVRPAGEWPGEDDFDNFIVLFWVIATVALGSAMLLVATTMNTLVRSQTREIGIMKALGANRRRTALSIGGTSLLLGLVGTLLGLALGIPVSNFLITFLGAELIGVEISWQVSWLAIVLSVVLGVGGTLLASIPATLRATRLSVVEAIGSPGIEADFGLARLDRVIKRVGFVPRPVQLGVRNAARRKGRSGTTIAQVALAVATMIGFTATVITMITISDQSRQAEGGDVWVYSTGSGRPLDRAAAAAVDGLSEVEKVQPLVYSGALVGDTETFVWGLPADPIYPYSLERGRWFSDAENRDPVVVIGPALARLHDLDVGSTLRLDTKDTAVELEVIGIDKSMVGDGLAMYAPVETVLEVRRLREPTEFWVATTSPSSAVVDRANVAIRAALDERGYGYDTTLMYVGREADERSDRTIVAVIMAMGIPIAMIGTIGLVSTMTTNMLERRREIGVLRSIGASSSDLRRIFRAEALLLVVTGWLAGIGGGYLLGRIIMEGFNRAFHMSFDLEFPVWPLGVALGLALVVSFLALVPPLRRVANLPPSEALRYQ